MTVLPTSVIPALSRSEGRGYTASSEPHYATGKYLT